MVSEPAAFLLDRLAEDEAVASALSAEGESVHGGRVLRMPYVMGELVSDRHPYLTDSWNPARTLRQVAAMRRVAENAQAAEAALESEPLSVQSSSQDSPAAAYWRGQDFVVRTLAASFADHPDYREEWAL